mmetsp:Transcript_20449/g.19669  ORF Transcript_20449/g.19669 Transcript_20449/m.19669 type:complete len:410 (-) Transcript_20449:208-1437(-)|eukprot:CAMPEP_0197834656 /NCGR_PEP_ID=MMETSP1437-20131217/23208_1 /TAXON_ID=49252 ORGANISM="Eucampia antarctica, Strain CCMP1452" /NCGR_SAMPLE_ID=MMETSP1437 /ASSEMBLY_ACC=CAM_ASM_001096 /LENGTH=409 /DNA_ID=CAMNT_0043439521 /DNA_START=73 /DNA_END=1302 /DNA_ORIENTATION=-
MSPKEGKSKVIGAETGGVYNVKESGVHFHHMPAPSIPKDGKEFLERLKDGLEINVLERPSKDELVFEIKGVDVSFANALRRIMIAEVPTVAIEHVYMWNNTSIVHDEVLAHRIGLVPLQIDSRHFDDFYDDDDEPTDRNTVVFRLNVTCQAPDKKNSNNAADAAARNNDGRGKNEKDSILGQKNMDTAAAESTVLFRATHPTAHQNNSPAGNNRPYTKHVYSSDLEWIPQGDQAQTTEGGLLRPVHEDILLAKLRPGQAIELEAHGRRSTGKDHAKYSPVATASYRLMPHVELLSPVYDELAKELANLYEPGVFDLVPCTEEDEEGHECKAVVVNPYASTMSRNYMRNEYLKEAVKVTRIPNHFIFNIESVGMMAPGVLLAESLKILIQKSQNLIRLADESLEAETIHE